MTLNVAALSGAVSYLGSVAHVASLGFYSTSYQWGVITGGTSTFSAYSSWVAGAADAAGASANCSGPGFTGGSVTLAQYSSAGFDANLRCPAPPVFTSIVVSPGTTSVATGGSVQFAATGYDQLGQPMITQPTLSWSVSGGGTVDAGGRFTAGSTAGGPYTVTASSGSVTGTASVAITSVSPDFSVSVGPALITIGRGGTATYTVRITPIGGFTSGVTLRASGAPAGSTVTFGTNPTGSSSTLTVRASRTGSRGTFTLTVTGTSGTLVRSAKATLRILEVTTAGRPRRRAPRDRLGGRCSRSGARL